MSFDELKLWVEIPENQSHPSFKDCLEELLLCRTLDVMKHNHSPLDIIRDYFESQGGVFQAHIVGMLVREYHSGDMFFQYEDEDAILRDLLKLVSEDARIKKPKGWIDNVSVECECEHDHGINEKINESLNLCETWIKTLKTSKTNSGS